MTPAPVRTNGRLDCRGRSPRTQPRTSEPHGSGPPRLRRKLALVSRSERLWELHRRWFDLGEAIEGSPHWVLRPTDAIAVPLPQLSREAAFWEGSARRESGTVRASVPGDVGLEPAVSGS